ncbi:helix-turn-helix domain-containing protein, partial [Micromonospora olivasterospora]
GAAISTDFDQPRIDDQASDGGNLGDWASDGRNLGDWATYQGPDMDWQPSLASWPAVTRTDAGTLHHPAGEPPTTPASPHPDQPQPQPQPAAGSRRVRDPGEARALFDQHAGHIATTTPRREQLRQLWNALIDRMDDNGIITASEPDLVEATSTPRPTVHHRIGVLRDRGLLQLVQESRGRVAARYGVSDPGPPRQAPLPAPPEGSQWLRDPGEARVLFDQHAGHIATTTPQREPLRQLWNALIDRMDDNGIITASEPDLAKATSTPRPTVHHRIGALLRDSGLLQLVQEGHAGGAARYGVSDPGPPRQAPLPAPPEGSQWLRDPGEARVLFDQHAGHIATTTPQREPLRQLWNALIDRMDDNGIITASLSDLAEATSTPRPTVHRRIGVLRDRGLLQLVQGGRGGGAARYGVSDPGQPRQAPLPGPALGPDRLDHGGTSPMPGPAPAPPAGTGMPGLPGPFDPDAPTASSWPAGWAEPAGPVPGIDVTAHGAAISTDFDQPGIDDQASDGGNLGDWATYQGPDM